MCMCMLTRRVFQEDEGSAWNVSEGQHGSNLPQKPPPSLLHSSPAVFPRLDVLTRGFSEFVYERLCSISTLTYGGQCWSVKTKYLLPIPATTSLYRPVCMCVVREVQGSWKHMTEHLRMDFNWLSVPECLKIGLHTRTDTKLHPKWFQNVISNNWMAFHNNLSGVLQCNTHFK